MINFIVRKICFKGMSAENKHTAELILESKKSSFLASLIAALVFAIPFAAALTLFVSNLNLLDVTSIIIQAFILLSALVFILLFIKKFIYEIMIFTKAMSLKLYLNHLLKGNALEIEDFETLKRDTKPIYDAIIDFKSNGFCYHVCFEILKTLKKGTFWFVAIRWNSEDEENQKPYTMHALYENNGWCYDTYSMTQHPFDFALDHFGAIKYLSFSYEDIKDLTFYEFREKTANELKAWCDENDCHEEWSDFSQT